MIQIALADNCPLIRRALKELFGKHAQYQLTWHASTSAELFQALPRKPPHILILDPAVAGSGSGLQLIEKLRTRHSRVPLLIYTTCAHQDIAVSSLQLGASGFLTKDSPEQDLLAAIRKVSNREVYLPSVLMEHLALLQLSPLGRHKRTNLSPREQQVMEGLAAGMPLTAIADKISCSAKTVSTHRARLLQKLGLHSNADLFRYSQNATLLQPLPSPRPAR